MITNSLLSARIRTLRLCLAFLLPVLVFFAEIARAQAVKVPATAAAATPAYRSDPRFIEALAEARQMEARKQTTFLADAYKKANKLAGGQCMECLRGEFKAQMASGSFKDAANAAAALEQLATAPSAKAYAEYLHAEAIYGGAGDKPRPEKLQAAHGLLQEAVANYPKMAAALFLDGRILAQMGQMDEAKADFAACVDCVGSNDPAKLRAEHFAENPELALHKMAPPFEVTALDGSRFNLDAMGGRVVLIDFWATWCGPCNAELPHMRKLAQEFAGQPLVILSVSSDTDEAKWKDFIARNSMTWVQYRDADHKLASLFNVNGIPHYFTIDSDGVLTSEMMGTGSDVEGKLKKLIAKAREAEKQTASTTPIPVPRSAGN